MPTHFTVSTEDYPLARRLYFYLPQKSTNNEAEEFVRFSATERGQSIVEDIGLVSQNIKTGQPFNNNFYPEEMRQQKIQEYKEKFANPYVAAAQGYIDEVIEPKDTQN